MPNLRPFRDYSEHDVINLFAHSGSTAVVSKGTFVKIQSGWCNDDIGSYEQFGPSYNNVVNLRHGVRAKVATCTSGDAAVGMTLYDVREFDENGEFLPFHPSKSAELQAVVSGQAVPIVTRGMFLYSGVNGTVVAGASLYPTTNGELTSQITGSDPTILGTRQSNRAAVALGPKDGRGFVLIRLQTV